MSKDKPTYRHLSEEELKDYLSGKVKGDGAHKLERRVLDDPFDREAFEGFSELPEALEDISALREKLKKASDKTPLPWLSIAAAVVLLFVSGWVIWFNFTGNTGAEYDRPISLNEPSEYSLEQPAMPKPPEPVIENVPEEVQTKEDNSQDETISAPPFDEEDAVAESFEMADVAAIDTPRIGNNAIAGEVDSPGLQLDVDQSLSGKVSGVRIEMGEAASNGAMDSRLKQYRRTRPGEVHGMVTDETGEPLPGVSVRVIGTANGAVTDLDGEYTIDDLPDDATLEFAFVGMESTETPVAGRDEVNVALSTDASSLSEVVVIGYGAEEEVKSGYQSAWPAIGMTEYREYLEQNLNYPEQAREQEIEGKVVLKLTIAADGSISDINVVRGPGHGCDEEAVRLVKEGPAWRPAQNDGETIESTVRVKVKFEL